MTAFSTVIFCSGGTLMQISSKRWGVCTKKVDGCTFLVQASCKKVQA